MAGNKHKNGIICRFPGCGKTMRTQKFKMHFTKMHLKQGEVYNLAHRQQFEVARDDAGNAGEAIGRNVLVKPEPMQGVSIMATGEAASEGIEALSAIAPSENKGIQTIQTMQPRHQAEQLAADASAAAGSIQHITLPSAAMEAGSEKMRGGKRPASAMNADPSNALLVQFVAMMDQRFQDLVTKMGEMIDVQKQLIDALQNNNPAVSGDQASALALASAAETVMKRQKTDASPPGDSSSSNNSATNGFVL